MAEYVRRKRPPASHPYWARLYDRAHPPQIVLPVVIPAAVGLGIGLLGGLQPDFSLADAVRLSAAAAGVTTGAVYVLAVLAFWMDGRPQLPGARRWTVSVLTGLPVAVVVFLVAFVTMFLLTLWYSVCTGQGPWLGMAYGALIGAGPAALIAGGSYRQWRERQRRWPRWERMRSPRRRPVLTVTSIPAPPPTGEPPRPWPPLGNGQ